MLEIEINRNPYKQPYNLFTKKKLVLKPGITNLIGCKYYGKSTLIEQIKRFCWENEIPYQSINTLLQNLNFSNTPSSIEEHLESAFGKVKELNKYQKFLLKAEGKPKSALCPQKFVILIDNIDQNLSVDVIKIAKEILSAIIAKFSSIEFYIVVSSISYEMTIGTNIMNTKRLRYIKNFSSYNAFDKFIMKTSEEIKKLNSASKERSTPSPKQGRCA